MVSSLISIRCHNTSETEAILAASTTGNQCNTNQSMQSLSFLLPGCLQGVRCVPNNSSSEQDSGSNLGVPGTLQCVDCTTQCGQKNENPDAVCGCCDGLAPVGQDETCAPFIAFNALGSYQS